MIRCLVVDDEPLARDLIEDNIRQIPYLILAGSCGTAAEAADFLQREQVDLMFLDIQMPGMTGLQLIRSLQQKPMIILITAYKTHALESYELDVIDYLVKPVSLDRFLKAVEKAREWKHWKKEGSDNHTGSPPYFFVHSEYFLVKVVPAQINYIEGLKDYIKIYTDQAPRPLITRLSMKAIEQQLSAGDFVRVHKSYIASLDKIQSIRKNRILVGNVEIPLSDFYRDNLYKILEERNLLM